MIYPDSNVAENTKIIKSAIDKMEAMIIGVGDSLSRTHYTRGAAGLAYDNAGTNNTMLLY